MFPARERIIPRVCEISGLSAIRHNPVIRAYYQGLLNTGKCKMSAVTAAMRKLLTVLNALLAKQQNWNKGLDAA